MCIFKTIWWAVYLVDFIHIFCDYRATCLLVLMCCWPCILMIINFRFQLNAQYFISIVMLLYMFRAHLCPSSGGPLHIYNIWFYVSLFWWLYSWKVSEGLQSLTNLPTARYVPLHVSGTLAPILRRTSAYLQHLVLCQSLLVTVQLEG